MKLFYREYGQGFPLIILHGLFGISDNWQTHAKRLGNHFHVYVPDQRNHGRSPHSKELSYEVLVQDLRDFLEDHHIESCHLLGHSMGGKVAMRFALDCPYIINKMIVVDIAPKYYPVLHRDIITALLSVNFQKTKSRIDIDEGLKELIPQPSIRQFLLKNLKRDKRGNLKWSINLEAINHNIEKISDGFNTNKSCTCPSLFIRGDLSYYVHDSDIELIERFFSNAILKTIGGTSHWLHAEKPDEFYSLVNEFLLS